MIWKRIPELPNIARHPVKQLCNTKILFFLSRPAKGLQRLIIKDKHFGLKNIVLI